MIAQHEKDVVDVSVFVDEELELWELPHGGHARDLEHKAGDDQSKAGCELAMQKQTFFCSSALTITEGRSWCISNTGRNSTVEKSVMVGMVVVSGGRKDEGKRKRRSGRVSRQARAQGSAREEEENEQKGEAWRGWGDCEEPDFEVV